MVEVLKDVKGLKDSISKTILKLVDILADTN